MEDLGVEIDFQILVKLVQTNLGHRQIDAHADFWCCLSNVNKPNIYKIVQENHKCIKIEISQNRRL